MSHPFKSAGHKNDPSWLKGVRKYADGGGVERPVISRTARAATQDAPTELSDDPATRAAQRMRRSVIRGID